MYADGCLLESDESVCANIRTLPHMRLQADILMVTDGEIPMPNEAVLTGLKTMQDELGLEVHGLLVSKNITEPMRQLCTHLHLFKSWGAVEAARY